MLRICSTESSFTRAAASSSASGMPSSRRQISATAAALLVGEREVRRNPLRAIHEELHGVGCRDRRACRARPAGVPAAIGPRTAARRRPPDPRGWWPAIAVAGGLEEVVDDGGDRGEHVLAVVEDQQQPAAADVIAQRAPQILVRALAHAEHAGDGLEHSAGIADRRQIDEPDPVRRNSTRVSSATRIASRVLPPPPIPVSVRSRVSSSSRTQSAISRSRPMNWVRGRGRWCVVPAGAGGAAAALTSVIAAAIASANCAVLANRSSGRFARPRATIRARAGGTAGRDSVTGRAPPSRAS